MGCSPDSQSSLTDQYWIPNTHPPPTQRSARRNLTSSSYTRRLRPVPQLPWRSRAPLFLGIFAAVASATNGITIEERPFGFGAQSGEQWIGAKITSVRDDRFASFGFELKPGYYMETIDAEDVRYMTYRDINDRLKGATLPIKITFWGGPDVKAAVGKFVEGDLAD